MKSPEPLEPFTSNVSKLLHVLFKNNAFRFNLKIAMSYVIVIFNYAKLRL